MGKSAKLRPNLSLDNENSERHFPIIPNLVNNITTTTRHFGILRITMLSFCFLRGRDFYALLLEPRSKLDKRIQSAITIDRKRKNLALIRKSQPNLVNSNLDKAAPLQIPPKIY